jgi:hypothetical protein
MYVSTCEAICFNREDSEGLSDKALCVVDSNRIGKEIINAFFSIVILLQLVRSLHLRQFLQRFGQIKSSMNCTGLATCSTIWTIFFVEVTGLDDFKADFRADVATGVLEGGGFVGFDRFRSGLIGLRRSICD